MGQGHDESSASAICTTSLQKAGEPIFEGAESRSAEEMRLLEAAGIRPLRSLHLLGATSVAKTIMHDGREHLVVPVIALMEGVIHAVNAETPEFVSADVLTKAAQSWVGKPICVGHPRKDGKQCSANSPEVLNAHGFGKIRSAVMKGTKLIMETLVDPLRLKALKQDRLLSDLREGKPVEVSVGAYVTTSKNKGEWNGKPYIGEWLETGGDHLAFLPGGRGACSLEMGCGAHRAAMHLVTAESIDVLTPARPPLVMFSALEDVALDERMQKVYQAVNDEWNDPPEPMAFPQQVFDDFVVVRKGDETYSVPYVVTKDGNVSLGKATLVKQTWVAAAGKMTDCPTCDGTGQVTKGNKQEDCPTCDGEGKVIRSASMKTLVGSRHSRKDAEMIQGVHDHAVALGAECDRNNYKMMEERHTCSCHKNEELRAATVKNEGGKWAVYTNDGAHRLGIHDTKDQALAHRLVIEERAAALSRN